MTDLRQACDRCHDKKLRCPKLPGASSCSRCAKAGAVCTFSPPTRAPFAHHQAQPLAWPESMGFDQMNGFATQLEPSFPGLSTTIASSTSHPALGLEDATSRADDQDELSASGVTAKLADLMVALDGIHKKIPKNEIYHVAKEDAQQWADHMEQTLNLRSTLEHILNCSQRLVTLYPLALEASTPNDNPTESDNTCSVPDCLHGYSSSHQIMPLPSLDHALLSLLVACHVKLLDIIQILVNHGRFCGQVTNHLPADSEPKFDIPVTRIGSFIAPSGAAASMFLCMVAELQALLVAKTRDFASLVSSNKNSPRETQVLSLQGDIIRDRTEGMMSEIGRLKDEMIKRGIMR